MLIGQKHPDDIKNEIPASFPFGRIPLLGAMRSNYLSTSSSPLGNEKGVALVTALVLGLIGMLMIATLLNVVGTGIWTSGAKRRYQTALEASRGGLDFFAKEIIQRGISGTSLSAMGNYTGGIFTGLATNADFTTKLTTTGSVGDGTYPATNPDTQLSFLLAGPSPNLTVNSTILSTSRGNSGGSQNTLVGGGVVSGQTGIITPLHIPYMYQIDSRGQGATSQENAILSSCYAY